MLYIKNDRLNMMAQEFYRKFELVFNGLESEKENFVQGMKPLLISGCTGAGKTTLTRMIIEKYPGKFKEIVSMTSRPRRKTEVDGVDYHFVTKEQFQKEIEANRFLEHCLVHGNHYGTNLKTLKNTIQKGKIPILIVDIQGAEKIYSVTKGFNYVFIKVKNLDLIQKRLVDRGRENRVQIEQRLETSRTEMKALTKLRYIYTNILSNEDDILDAFRNFEQLVLKMYSKKLIGSKLGDQ